jgi:hypothetical protein
LIVNQKKNASFRTTLEYVLGKEKSSIIDTNMGGDTPRQLAAEFAAARRLRPNLKRACGHIIISIPHREADHSRGEYHEHLDSDEYVELAHRWLKGMEFLGEELSCSQYLIARHHDTKHEHIHIIASRIRMDGSVVSDSWDYRRSEVIVRQLEKEFNLEPTPCSNERVALIAIEQGIETTVSDRRAPTSKQKHHHSGQPTVKQRLAALIDEATQDNPTVKQLIGRLQHQGVKVYPQFSTRGLFKEALAFELDGVKVAGNKLGSAYSFPGLLRKRGVSYDPERDNPALEAAAAGEVVPREPSPPASTKQTIQHQEKEPPPPELSTTKPPFPFSQEMHLLAQQFYAHASRLWNQRKLMAKEVSPGKWILQGVRYAITYDTNQDHFWVSDRQRGVLVENKASKFSFTQQLTPQDVENFAQFVQQQPAPKPQKQHKAVPNRTVKSLSKLICHLPFLV